MEKVQITGQITKFLSQMKQGEKKSQNTKVDKNLLKAKENVLDDLMNQVGGDDEEEKGNNNNRNNNRLNFQIIKF